MGAPFRIGLKERALLILHRKRYLGALLATTTHALLAVSAPFVALAAVWMALRFLPWLLPALAGLAAIVSPAPSTAGFPSTAVLAAVLTVFAVGAAAAAAALSVLFLQPLSAARAHWFLRNRKEERAPAAEPLRFFRTGRYGTAVRTAALRFLAMLPSLSPAAAVAAASILLLSVRFTTDLAGTPLRHGLALDTAAGLAFPAIVALAATAAALLPAWVRSYAFLPVPWILASRPALDPAAVVRLAERMTRGRRTDLFLLDLSFAGWAAASLLVCGAGLPFVAPYYEAVRAEAYARLLEESELTDFG